MSFKGLYLVSVLVCCAFFSKAEEILTLERALAIAEKNSPSMQKALLSREQSRQSLIAQKAALKARISLGVNPLNYNSSKEFNEYYSKWYSREYLSSYGTFKISQPILPTNTTVSLVNTFGWQRYRGDSTLSRSFENQAYLKLEQPLFTYNSQKLNLKELELCVENAEIEYKLNRLSLEQQVTGLFYRVYMAQLKLEVAKEELSNTRLSRSAIADKVEEGLAATVELYQADLNLSTAKSTLRNYEVNLENTKADFCRFIGNDLNRVFSVSLDMSRVDTFSIQIQEAVDHGLGSRMELRQRKIEMEYEQFNMTRIRALNEFAGSVSLSVGIQGYNEKPGKIYDTPTRTPNVGIAFNIPICDWGERKARIKAQNAVLKSKKIDLDYERTLITTEIGTICRNLDNYRTQIEIEKQNQENARLAYDISLEKYRNGDLTSMDLNLYQTQLSNKKISMAQAQINYKMEMLNLKIASLYDFEKGEALLPVDIQ